MDSAQQTAFAGVRHDGTAPAFATGLSDQLLTTLRSWVGDYCTLFTPGASLLGKLVYIGADGAIISTMQPTGEISVDGKVFEGLVDTFIPFAQIRSLNPTPVAATPTKNYTPGADGWSNAINTPATTAKN